MKGAISSVLKRNYNKFALLVFLLQFIDCAQQSSVSIISSLFVPNVDLCQQNETKSLETSKNRGG